MHLGCPHHHRNPARRDTQGLAGAIPDSVPSEVRGLRVLRSICVTLNLTVVMAVILSGCAHVNGNFRTVEPGACYRSGQMDSTRLDIAIRRHGIRTVVNLRGPSPEESWYRGETRLCAGRGVAHHDLEWTMTQPPTPESLHTFVNLVRGAEKPILVHCQGGVHRAAVAAACFRLLQGEPVENVREELGFFFNNAPIGQLLDLYAQSALPFDQWVFNEYPAHYRARQEEAATAG